MSEDIKCRDTALSNENKAVHLRLIWLRLSTILKPLSLHFLFVICCCSNLSHVCVCAWFWLSLSENFTSYLLNSTENTTWARNEGHVTAIFSIALWEKASYWPRLANTTAKKFYQTIFTLFSTLTVDICSVRLLTTCWLFPANYYHHTNKHLFWLRGMEEQMIQD